MKKILLLILLFTTQQAFSQVAISKDFTYTLSNPYEVVDGSKDYFTKENEILTVKYFKGNFIFQKFSGDKMNEKKRVVVPNNLSYSFSVSHQEIDGKFYFFYSLWDKESTTETLYVREIDFVACQFISEGRKLFSVSGKLTGGILRSGYSGGNFSILKSNDESKVLIQHRINPENKNEKNNNIVLGLHVYDSDIKELWSIDAEMPYNDQTMTHLKYTIDSKSNVYVFTTILKKDSQTSNEPSSSFELFKINSVDQSISSNEIKLKDKIIISSETRFFEGKNGELGLAGFYSNIGKDRGIDGFFLSRIKEDAVSDIQFYEVPLEVMKMYQSNRAQKKMDKKDEVKDLKLRNMTLREITYDSKGDITIYAEKNYQITSTDPKTGSTSVKYFYQEIVGVGIDADGELKWMNKFPKNQTGRSGRGGMGYFLISNETSDYLLFLDNVKNIELPLNQFPSEHRDGIGGYLTGFKVNRDTGIPEKISLFDTKDAKGTELYQFNTERIIKVNENTFSVECYKKKKEDVMVTIFLE